MAKLPLALVGFVLILLGYFLYVEENKESQSVSGTETYESSIYGISFSYPEDYVVSEREADAAHHIVTLVRAKDATPPENGEGPTGITIEVFDNRTNHTPLAEWITNNPSSNFVLGDRTHTSTSVAGMDALRYRWSGLYEGETVAFTHAGQIITVSVTRLSAEDHTDAYSTIVSTIELSEPSR